VCVLNEDMIFITGRLQLVMEGTVRKERIKDEVRAKENFCQFRTVEPSPALVTILDEGSAEKRERHIPKESKTGQKAEAWEKHAGRLS